MSHIAYFLFLHAKRFSLFTHLGSGKPQKAPPNSIPTAGNQSLRERSSTISYVLFKS